MSSDKVKLSKDGSSIDFVQSDSVPTSVKKFRQSPEIEGFYRFIFENDLQREACEILERIIAVRKAKKAAEKAQQKAEKAATKAAEEAVKIKLKAPAVKAEKVVAAKPVKAALAKKAAKPAAKPAVKAKAAAKKPTKPVAKAKAKPAAKKSAKKKK